MAQRVLIVQHERDGGPGLLGEHLTRRGYELDVVQVMQPGTAHSDVEFPEPDGYAAVVPLGSVRGVYERDQIGSWIDRELHLLRSAHERGVPVFGICFGAQAIAAALGGEVEPSPRYELGWFSYPGNLLPDVIGDGAWFTWHGDRLLLPPGIEPLAETDVCTQAFRTGRTAGVQFHPEVTRDMVAGWVEHLPASYFDERGTSAVEVLGGFEGVGADVATRAATLFDWFLDDVAAS